MPSIIILTDGFDCNNATNMGVYYSTDTSVSNSIVHSPASNNGEFVLVSLMVRYGFQLFFSGRTEPHIWFRYKDTEWITWKPFILG